MAVTSFMTVHISQHHHQCYGVNKIKQNCGRLNSRMTPNDPHLHLILSTLSVDETCEYNETSTPVFILHSIKTPPEGRLY